MQAEEERAAKESSSPTKLPPVMEAQEPPEEEKKAATEAPAEETPAQEGEKPSDSSEEKKVWNYRTLGGEWIGLLISCEIKRIQVTQNCVHVPFFLKNIGTQIYKTWTFFKLIVNICLKPKWMYLHEYKYIFQGKPVQA